MLRSRVVLGLIGDGGLWRVAKVTAYLAVWHIVGRAWVSQQDGGVWENLRPGDIMPAGGNSLTGGVPRRVGLPLPHKQ